MNRKIEITSDFLSPTGAGKFAGNLTDSLVKMNCEVSLDRIVFEPDCVVHGKSSFGHCNLFGKNIMGSHSLLISPKSLLTSGGVEGKCVFIKTDMNSVPKTIIDILKESSRVFAVGEFTKSVLLNSGLGEKVIVVHPCVSRIDISRVKRVSFAGRRGFSFLSVVSGINDIEWEGAVRAYFKAFRGHEDVCFVIKPLPRPTSAFHKNELFRKIENIKREISPNGPPIIVLNSYLSDLEMYGLYSRVDCFVKPYSFGFGMSLIEAFQSGLICMTSGFGDCRDMLNDKNALLIEKEGEEKVRGNRLLESVTYNKYNVNVMADMMRYVYEHCDELKEKTNKGRKLSLSPFSNNYVAYDLMMKLRDKT